MADFIASASGETTAQLLHVSASPHIRGAATVRGIHTAVLIALIPVMAGALAVYGVQALVLLLVSVSAAVATEYLIARFLMKCTPFRDFSALITGILYACTLPAGLHPLIAALGAVVAIAIGKWAFGGLGNTIVNPALLGRLFVAVSYPADLARYLPNIYGTLSGTGGFHPDAVSGATPLATVKMLSAAGSFGTVDMSGWFLNLFLGNVGGAIGGASVLAVLIGAGYLLFKRIIAVSIPLSLLLSALVLGLLLDARGFSPFSQGALMAAAVQTLTGGIMLAAFFMATDPATSPMTLKGRILFGTGCGLLLVCARTFSSWPDGVGFAILFMNCLVPLIDRVTIPRPFGRKGIKNA